MNDVDEATWKSGCLINCPCCGNEYETDDMITGLTPEKFDLHSAAPMMLEALEKASEDINWMLNNQKFLNPDTFNYLDAAIAKATGDQS